MRRCCLLLVCLLLLTGCGRADTQDVSSFAPAEGDRLVIFTSHKETIYEPILKEFEQRTGIWVELETGGTVTLLERIAAGESGADLMFGGGADSLSAYSACFAPYVSEYAGDVAPEYDLGGGIWTPFSALPVVLIYNTKLVRQNPPCSTRAGAGASPLPTRPFPARAAPRSAPFCRPSAATPTTPSPRSSAILTDASSPTAAAWSPPWQTAAATSA